MEIPSTTYNSNTTPGSQKLIGNRGYSLLALKRPSFAMEALSESDIQYTERDPQ